MSHFILFSSQGCSNAKKSFISLQKGNSNPKINQHQEPKDMMCPPDEEISSNIRKIKAVIRRASDISCNNQDLNCELNLRQDYEDAYNCIIQCESIINSLQEQVVSKDERIASLEKQIIQMSLELAKAKAKEDEHILFKRKFMGLRDDSEHSSIDKDELTYTLPTFDDSKNQLQDQKSQEQEQQTTLASLVGEIYAPKRKAQHCRRHTAMDCINCRRSSTKPCKCRLVRSTTSDVPHQEMKAYGESIISDERIAHSDNVVDRLQSSWRKTHQEMYHRTKDGLSSPFSASLVFARSRCDSGKQETALNHQRMRTNMPLRSSSGTITAVVFPNTFQDVEASCLEDNGILLGWPGKTKSC